MGAQRDVSFSLFAVSLLGVIYTALCALRSVGPLFSEYVGSAADFLLGSSISGSGLFAP
jgi:hypothetical protein